MKGNLDLFIGPRNAMIPVLNSEVGFPGISGKQGFADRIWLDAGSFNEVAEWGKPGLF
jgi:hypothetical protein